VPAVTRRGNPFSQPKIFPRTHPRARVREALAQSAAAAEAQRTLDIAHTELAKAEREMRSQQRLLVGAPADAASVHELRLPSKASANALQAALEDLQRSQKTAENEQVEAAKQLAKVKRELAQLERRGALPSAKDLAQAREQRETVWRTIVSLWSRGEEEGRESLVGLHEETQKRTDDLADELREHADQVAKADQLRDSMVEIEEDIAAIADMPGVAVAAASRTPAVANGPPPAALSSRSKCGPRQIGTPVQSRGARSSGTYALTCEGEA